MLVKPLVPGKKVQLSKIDPASNKGFPKGKDESLGEMTKINEKLEILQERLFAEGKHRILVILQGMDTSGKDGTVRSVFEGVNPSGVRVAPFKVPTPIELSHDYLWRVHQQTPGKGEITIFNRSHYEDVLVVRVHNLVPEEVWMKRYQQINEFEKMLTEEGTLILKFFLHISKEEQKQRLLDRLNEPDKHWKFNPSDIKERALWDEYTRAYEDVLEKTTTAWAPWTVVPANRKWYRNLVIGEAMVKALEDLKIRVPPALPEADVALYRSQLMDEGKKAS